MTSTNKVVANAMAANEAVACNLGRLFELEFKNGMKIRCEAKTEEAARFQMARIAAKMGGIKSVTAVNAVAENAEPDEASVVRKLEQIYRQLEQVRQELNRSRNVELRTKFLRPISDAMNDLDYN